MKKAMIPRKIRLIYPEFQRRLILSQVLSIGLTVGIIGWQHYRSFAHLHELGVQVKLPPDHPYFEFLRYESGLFRSYLLSAFVIASAFSFASCLALSHRLAGPIVRMRRYLEKVISSRALAEERLEFRQGDFFADLPPLVDAALRAARDGAEAPSVSGRPSP